MSKAFPIEISSDSDPSQVDSANSSFHYDAFPPFQCESPSDKMMSEQFDLQGFLDDAFPPHFDQGVQDYFSLEDFFKAHPLQWESEDFNDEKFQDQFVIKDLKKQEPPSRREEITPILFTPQNPVIAIPQKERVVDSGNGVNSKRSFEALYMNQQEPEKRVNKVFIPHQICNNIVTKKSLQSRALEESSHWSEDSVDDYITDQREFHLYPKNLLVEEGQDEASSLSSNPLRFVFVVKYKIRLAQEQEGSLANMKQKSEMVSKKHDLFIL